MFYVYLIRSIKNPQKKYVGFTTDLRERLTKHNEGGSKYTSDYRPWKLVTCVRFSNKKQALDFEKYLKSHSGRAFAEKRFW